MKICVLNGSPKGDLSVTMQYVRFLREAYPGHVFTIENVGQKVHLLETKEEEWNRMIGSVAGSDLILFAAPVYYMLVPAQLKRFVELCFARNVLGAYAGRYAAALTTSIHYFDHTAHAYLHAISEDLGMHWAGSFSAKMDDLLSVAEQEKLVLFLAGLAETVTSRRTVQRAYDPVTSGTFLYRPGPAPVPFDAKGKQVAILSDAAPGSNLDRMVTRLSACFGKAATVIAVGDVGIQGGCLGCCHCAFDNTCVYTDGFSAFWNEQVLSADILILACTVKDRYFSSDFKKIFDRSFFVGHVPNMTGKQMGILVEGPLAQLITLREWLTAYPAGQGANLSGIVTDEGCDSAALDARIDALAAWCLYLAASGYITPATFPSVAGKKILRDEIYESLRVVFRADHRYYRKHGFYDFPPWQYGRRLKTALMSFLLDLPPVQKKAAAEMKQHMIEPFAQVFAKSPVLQGMKDRQ